VEDPAGIMASLSISFTRTIPSTTWEMSAHAGLTNGSVDNIIFGIYPASAPGKPCKGTRHRAFNHNALVANLGKIISDLTALAGNEALMKCPKCKTGWVHMKEPTIMSTKSFRPFLSCDGMQIVRSRSKGKHVACDGTSTAIPALFIYR
jgi:hypothetical protein